MDRFVTGNRIGLLRSGAEYFPALERAIGSAQVEIWLESYIFADDATGRRIAEALCAAARRGVKVRVLVDGWGAKFYLTPVLERTMRKAGVELLKYRPEVSAWQFRSHRLRRLHRKLCQIDHRIAFVGGINVIDDMNTPGHTPPRLDFAVSVEGPLIPAIAQTMQRVWALVQLVQFGTSQLPLFPERGRAERVGTQTAKFIIRDNLRHRRDIEQAYLAAIRGAKREIIIVTLILQAKVEYVLLHFASRAMYGQLLQAGVVIQEYHKSMLHAKVAVIDDRWATVGSSNIDPYSLLVAREANVVVRDRAFATELTQELGKMVETGSQRVIHQDWQSRSRLYKAAIWIAYGIVRGAMGLLGYGGDEWFPKRPRAERSPG